MPKAWAEDVERRRKVGVPEDVTFKSKSEIALDHFHWAHETGLPGKMMLVDAGYDNDSRPGDCGRLGRDAKTPKGTPPPSPSGSIGRTG